MRFNSRLASVLAALAMLATAGCDDIFTEYHLTNTEYDVGNCSTVYTYCTVGYDLFSDQCYYLADGKRFYFDFYEDYYVWDEVLTYCYDVSGAPTCDELTGADRGDCYRARYCTYTDGLTFYEAETADGYSRTFTCYSNHPADCQESAENFMLYCHVSY